MAFIAQSSACCRMAGRLIRAACSECCSAADRARWFKTCSTRGREGHCRPVQWALQPLKSAANKNVTGLIKFSGKAAKLRDGRPVSHFAAWEVSTRMWRVTILWPLIGHWVSKQAFSLAELCNPDTGTGWLMFRCFGKAVRSWGDVCTLRVTNPGRSDGLYHGITIWHTNILSRHNINQPTAEKWLQKWLLGNGKAWCRPDCSLRPHIICSITRHSLCSQPASLSQLCSHKKWQNDAFESRLPPIRLASSLACFWCVGL